MTTEEKAKAYDEALKRARMYHDNAKAVKEYAAVARYENIFPELRKEEKPLTPFQQCLSCILRGVYYAEAPYKEVKEFILKVVRTRTDELVELAKRHEYTDCQLRESEDERIRQELIRYIKNWKAYQYNKGCCFALWSSDEEDCDKILAWLEKQKEPKPNYCHYGGDPNVERCKHCSTVCSGRLAEEQKPVDDKAFEEWIDGWWKHNKVSNPDSYDKGDEIQFDEKGFKNFCRGIKNMYQQKPANNYHEWRNIVYYVLKEWLGIGQYMDLSPFDDIVKTLQERYSLPKSAEWSEKHIADIFEKVGLAKTVREQGNDALTNALQDAMLELSKLGNTAWSEEDEKMLKCCLIAINHYEKTCNIGDHLPTKFNIDGYLASVDKVKSWLKSLRPSWKPSEDEERLINTAISFLKDFADKGYENAVECIDWLKSKLNGNTCK